MKDKTLDALIQRIDKDAKLSGNVRQLVVEGRPVVVVSDEKADRMRIMSVIGPASALDADQLRRVLQANFDAVLDARYAIAQGMVWSAFIHPLSPLSERQFYSGLAQVVVAAETFGTTYSSGSLVFTGGDSEGLHRKLYERILKQGKIKI